MATLVNVKTMQCGGSLQQFEGAIYDVVGEHIAFKANPPQGWRGSVINMSLKLVTRDTTELEFALRRAYNEGIPIAAAAGNSGEAKISIPAV